MSLAIGFHENLVNMAETILAPSKSRGQDHDLALICIDEMVTYKQLWSRVNQAGNAFLGLEVASGDRVILMVRDTPAFFYVYLGLMMIGAVPTAINIRLSNADVAYTMNDSRAKAIVLDNVFLKDYQDVAKEITLEPKVISTDVKHSEFY